MAGDRHGKHNTTTISFRVNSYEKATIEERVKVSGMKKQDYIVRSCIYNHVCVVGKKETIEIIRSEMKEMSLVLEDVAKDLKSEKPVISEPVLDSMTERYLAFLEAALWMLKGSSYLWEDKKDGIRKREERKDRLHQNYLKRKASGAQKRYEDKIREKKKAEIDAKKAAIRAEDIAKGVFIPVSSLPQREPQKGAQTA